jgi:hypothetical protein
MFDGLSASIYTTDFVADDSTGGYTFSGSPSETNTADFSTAANGVTANLSTGPATVGFKTASPSDTLNCIGFPTLNCINTVMGSMAGGNSFVASPTNSQAFRDNGTVGGDTVDFSGMQETSSSTLLVINPTKLSSPGTPSPFTATFGSQTYTLISQNPNATDFTNFVGASSGNTNFLAGGSTGLSFTGLGGVGNTADFSNSLHGVTADMLHGKVTFATLAGSDTLHGAISTVMGSRFASNAFDGALTDTTFQAQNGSAGNSVSYAGLSPVQGGVMFGLPSETGVGAGMGLVQGISGSLTGDIDNLNFPAGQPLTVEGSPSPDTFQISTAPVTLQGGGGADTIDLSQVTPPAGGAGVTVNLNGNGPATPAISGPTLTAKGVSFTASSCGSGSQSPTDVCVSQVTGSTGNDTFIANTNSFASPSAVNFAGNGQNDTLMLSQITSALGLTATVDMPITSGTSPVTNPPAPTCNISALPAATGAVCSNPGATPAITFTGISTVYGTNKGGDHFFAGSGTESLNEGSATGTLDYSVVPLPQNDPTGITVDATQTGPTTFTGTVNSPLDFGVMDTFTGFATFIGTANNDNFTQADPGPPGGYSFKGGAGSNTIDLSNAVPAGSCATPPCLSILFSAPMATDGCTGTPNNDGTATFTVGVVDHFYCMGTVSSLTSEYQIQPGQSALIDGGGQGTLKLVQDMTGNGVTVTLPRGPSGTGTGTVTGDGYNFSFKGMSAVDGTPFNDVFYPGSGNVTLVGGGGNAWLDYANATSPADINLSNTAYTIPATAQANRGTNIAADTAIGGNGGVISISPTGTGISNVVDTAGSDDLVVLGSGSGRVIGGTKSAANDTFVPTGGNDIINGGSGTTNTIDLSQLTGSTTLDLWSSSRQLLGPEEGNLTLVPGTIETAIASQGGSTLEAGNGNNITLYGGLGNDTLVAGTGNNQTLNACEPTVPPTPPVCGGNDVLVAGIGSDNLIGGSVPVTFMPGSGSGAVDKVTSGVNGNTLSYANVPVPTPWKRPPLTGNLGALINVTSQPQQVPNGPLQGTALPADEATGGWGATVMLPNPSNIISTVVGSSAPDIMVTGSNNILSGGGGNDVFVVDGDGNSLTAANGSASRFVFVASGSNTIHGGGSSTVDFSRATSTLNVNLLATQPGQPGVANGGFGNSQQTLFGVLNAIGGQGTNTLMAGQSGATLTGGTGNNALEIAPTGKDTLIGGSGDNVFCAQAGCKGVTQALPGNTLVGGPGNNLYCAQNGGKDTITANPSAFSNTAFVDLSDVPFVTGITDPLDIITTPSPNC